VISHFTVMLNSPFAPADLRATARRSKGFVCKYILIEAKKAKPWRNTGRMLTGFPGWD
ncbi:MAG: hypothetical protein HW376_891, partial [candidate division NC10 bacterium]|nr:hypothetical protein [candidate division NC10 bacterium]